MRLIDPFGAGGGPDLLARALAPGLFESWVQPVTVANMPAAGATPGPAQIARSAADGCTLLIDTNAPAYSAAFAKNLPYDTLRDFIPIVPLTRQPSLLVAGKDCAVHAGLARDVGHHRGGLNLADVQRTAGMAERAQQQRVTESVDRPGRLRCRFGDPTGKLLPTRWPRRETLRRYHD